MGVFVFSGSGKKVGHSSAVSKRGRSKRGRTQTHAKERERAQMSAERKRKSAKERNRALPRKNCKNTR